MKKLLIMLLAVLLLQLGETTGQSIRLRLPDSTALVGSSIVLPVYADSTFTGQNVISYQIQLTYTSSHLLADSLIVTGTMSAGANPIANFSSSGLVTVAAATATPLSGTGVLFYIRFRVISSFGGYSTAINFSSTTNTYLNQGSPTLTFRNGTLIVPALPTITVSPGTANLVVGDTLHYTANGGRQPYSWRLADSTRGTIQALTATTARFIAATAGRTRVIATDSNGFIGQTSQEMVVNNFRMWSRDSSKLQGTELLLPIYVGNLTPWNLVSGSFDVSLSNLPGLILVGIERNGTLLAAVNQTFFAQQGTANWEVSFANATPITGSGILCYLRIAVPNLYTYNYNFSVNLLNSFFNQNLTALTTISSHTAIALPQIAITPNTADVVAGESRQFTASNGFAPYHWSVSDSNRATISQTGLLTARQGGVVTVTATDTVNASRTTGNIQLYDTRLYLRDTVLISGDTLVDVAVFMDQLPLGKSITAFSLAFDYNNTFLEPLNVLQTGTATAGWSAATNRIGNNRFSIALAGTTPTSGAGNLFFIRFKVFAGFTVNNLTSLSTVQATLNEGNPNYLLVNGQIRSLPCNPTATVSPSGNVTFCANQPTQLSGSSGTAFQYQWSRNGVVVVGANNRLFTPTLSGNYTLRVALNSSCFVISDTVRVTINPSPIAQISPYADSLHACSGDTVQLLAYREPGYTLQWFRNGGTLSGATDSIFKVVLSGSYTVRATLNGCQAVSAAQIVNIRPLPAKPTIIVSGSPVCAGDSATLRIPATSLQKQWFNASGSLVGATDTLVRVAAGRYTVRLTDSFGCRIYADSVTVVAATASAQIDPSGPTTFCQGGTINLDLTQPTTYVRWFRNGVQLTDTIRPLAVNQSGSYTASYRLSGNVCIFATPAVQISVTPRPVVTLDTLVAVCANVPSFLLSGGLPVGGTYVGPGVSNNRFNPAAVGPGTYTIKYGVQQNGCSDTASRIIQVFALPGTTFPAPAAVCVTNASFALTGGLPTGGTYFGTAVTAGSFNPGIAGVGTHNLGYTTQNANGCRDTVLRTITVNPLPTATISQGASVAFCQGSTAVLSANTATGLTYQWLRNGLVLGGQTAANLTVNQTGNYRVLVTNVSNCSDSSSVTSVTENPLPNSTLTPAGATTFCQGSSVLLNGINAADRSYRWLLNGSPVTGNLSSSLTASSSGQYRLIVTNTLSGCFDTSAATTITVNPRPIAQITPQGATIFCVGDNVVLNANLAANLSYQWLLNGSPLAGSTSSSFTATAAGNYRVILTNTITACFDTSAAVNVVVNPRPTASLTAAGSTTLCQGSNVVLNANTGTGFSYQWLRNGGVISGQTASQLTATLAGDYRVLVTSAAACSDTSASVTVTVNPTPDPAVLSINIDTIFASPGTDLTWFRNGILLAGVTDSVLLITQDGNYNALRTSTLGCASDTSNTVVVTNVGLENQQLLQVKMYPNPTERWLNLQLTGDNQENFEVEIRALTGQLVLQKQWPAGSYSNPIQLDLADLPQAVYVLRLKQGERYRHERLILQR